MLVGAIAVIANCAPTDMVKPPAVEQFEFIQMPDKAYEYSYRLDNGQYKKESGSFHKEGDRLVLRVEGAYSYTGDDGKIYEVHYTSDENGFRASGDHLPDTKTFVEPREAAPRSEKPIVKPKSCSNKNSLIASLIGGGNISKELQNKC